jgi:aminoglycoside phosphotransferase (APT) family kinase protein
MCDPFAWTKTADDDDPACLGSFAGRLQRWLEAEAQAALELLGRTRFPTPEPVALGEPGPGYPLPWSVQTWLLGTVAGVDDPSRSLAFAHDLAEFVHDVRNIDTRGRTFQGLGRRGRGGHLARSRRLDADLLRAW